MTPGVVLVCCYALLLLTAAYGFDRMARRAAVKSQRWRTGSFRYHSDHDAWTCPEDQWLWPTSFDPEQRIVRYRAKPSVCNSCPVKSTCTTSEHGREIGREVDPWPHSEAGRFHRGISCCIAVLAALLPAGMLLSRPPLAGVALLLGTMTVSISASVPLARHLWQTPSGFPEHIPQSSLYAEPAADRFTTLWGSFGAATSQPSSKEAPR
ncbi:MAG TPA: hypothetical protein VEQ66_17560 [Propionibacteriaceae bacterium]|nr:hypothetical protein [Propionibacteriaceae bacterium]